MHWSTKEMNCGTYIQQPTFSTGSYSPAFYSFQEQQRHLLLQLGCHPSEWRSYQHHHTGVHYSVPSGVSQWTIDTLRMYIFPTSARLMLLEERGSGEMHCACSSSYILKGKPFYHTICPLSLFPFQNTGLLNSWKHWLTQLNHGGTERASRRVEGTSYRSSG